LIKKTLASKKKNSLFKPTNRYDSHSLSRKAIDRIFDQIPRKFTSSTKDKMNFEDFVWYMLSEEDKTKKTSIEYWFKVVDLDENGIITSHEMEYFLEEQIYRIDCTSDEAYSVPDLICQLYF
jgi:serine/threonine-protein phosphatase 2A regulatory subunit B''